MKKVDWSFYSQTLLSNCSPPQGRKQGEEGVDVTSLWSPSFLFWIDVGRAAAKLCDLSWDSYSRIMQPSRTEFVTREMIRKGEHLRTHRACNLIENMVMLYLSLDATHK